MPRVLNLSAFGVSTGVHAAVLTVLAFFTLGSNEDLPDLTLETVFVEDRMQEDFSQELEESSEIATELNPVAGGLVSTKMGTAGGPPALNTNIEESESLKDPEIQVNVGDISMPTDSLLTEELGEGAVTGETGAVVEGYGAALSRMAQELVRMMRTQRVHVVWLFDESDSMEDDQKKIREKFDKIYGDVGLAQEKDEKLRAQDQVLLTSIWGYGATHHELTKQPTADLDVIREAIGNIPVDESGEENMCQAIREAIKKFRAMSGRQKRKLVIVIVSDESGDDGMYVEDAIEDAKRTKTPIYVLGREAVFGYPYARQRWTDPDYGLTFHLRVNRGPETALPEALQWDGLHARWDVNNSGFGPYEMVRLAKETNGIFFVLPGKEENLSGRGALERRKFQYLDMKEYQPLLLARKTYLDQIQASPFRKAVFDSIVMLNPNENEMFPSHDPQLNIREIHYSIVPQQFVGQADGEVLKAVRAMTILNQVIPVFEKIAPLRDLEPSRRWRANYDLAYAQLLSYRVRLFQYLLAMDHHVNAEPFPKKENTNVWNIRRSRETMEPDEAQFERIRQAFKIRVTMEEYLQGLKEQERLALEMYERVKKEHSGTPWAKRAQDEINRGFGMKFVEGFRNPNWNRFESGEIKVKPPKL